MDLVKGYVRTYVPRNIRNWLRSPAYSTEWIWDEIKYALGVRQIAQMRPGWFLLCHPAAYRFAYCAHNIDSDQVAEIDGFIAACWPGMALFDLGAHFGLFSLAALRYGGVDAKAIAVDPSPTASRMMRIQANLNHVADRLTIVQASIGEHTGWRPMVAVGVLAAGYFVAPGRDHPDSELARTPAITLDGLAHDSGILPTHVKIDVEGYEAEVLRGGRELLSQTESPLLFIELHNQITRERNEDPEEPLALLRSLGYDTFTVNGDPLNKESVLSRPLIRIMARKPRG